MSKHTPTPGALAAALKILLGLTPQVSVTDWRQRELAEIIDLETHAPELLEVCKAAERALEAARLLLLTLAADRFSNQEIHTVFATLRSNTGIVKGHIEPVATRITAAIAKAEA